MSPPQPPECVLSPSVGSVSRARPSYTGKDGALSGRDMPLRSGSGRPSLRSNIHNPSWKTVTRAVCSTSGPRGSPRTQASSPHMSSSTTSAAKSSPSDELAPRGFLSRARSRTRQESRSRSPVRSSFPQKDTYRTSSPSNLRTRAARSPPRSRRRSPSFSPPRRQYYRPRSRSRSRSPPTYHRPRRRPSRSRSPVTRRGRRSPSRSPLRPREDAWSRSPRRPRVPSRSPPRIRSRTRSKSPSKSPLQSRLGSRLGRSVLSKSLQSRLGSPVRRTSPPEVTLRSRARTSRARSRSRSRSRSSSRPPPRSARVRSPSPISRPSKRGRAVAEPPLPVRRSPNSRSPPPSKPSSYHQRSPRLFPRLGKPSDSGSTRRPDGYEDRSRGSYGRESESPPRKERRVVRDHSNGDRNKRDYSPRPPRPSRTMSLLRDGDRHSSSPRWHPERAHESTRSVEGRTLDAASSSAVTSAANDSFSSGQFAGKGATAALSGKTSSRDDRPSPKLVAKCSSPSASQSGLSSFLSSGGTTLPNDSRPTAASRNERGGPRFGHHREGENLHLTSPSSSCRPSSSHDVTWNSAHQKSDTSYMSRSTNQTDSYNHVIRGHFNNNNQSVPPRLRSSTSDPHNNRDVPDLPSIPEVQNTGVRRQEDMFEVSGEILNTLSLDAESNELRGDAFFKAPMSSQEWQDFRSLALMRGNEDEKLAFKLLQEILLSPNIGMDGGSLRKLSEELGNVHHIFDPDDGGLFASLEDLPEVMRKALSNSATSLYSTNSFPIPNGKNIDVAVPDKASDVENVANLMDDVAIEVNEECCASAQFVDNVEYAFEYLVGGSIPPTEKRVARHDKRSVMRGRLPELSLHPRSDRRLGLAHDKDIVILDPLFQRLYRGN